MIEIESLPWATQYPLLLANYEPGSPEALFFEDLIETVNALIRDNIGDPTYGT